MSEPFAQPINASTRYCAVYGHPVRHSASPAMRKLRVVDTAGRIRTVVNASGKKGSGGDGGNALDATLNGPKHLCVDKDNTVIIVTADHGMPFPRGKGYAYPDSNHVPLAIRWPAGIGTPGRVVDEGATVVQHVVGHDAHGTTFQVGKSTHDGLAIT